MGCKVDYWDSSLCKNPQNKWYKDVLGFLKGLGFQKGFSKLGGRVTLGLRVGPGQVQLKKLRQCRSLKRESQR